MRTLVFAALTLAGANAFAEEPQATVVQLEAHGERSDVDALRASLEDWLKPLRLELKVVEALPLLADPEVAARVRVEWTDAVCTVDVRRVDGVSVRRKDLPRTGAPLLVSESAALVAQAGVQELVLIEARRVRTSSQPPLLEASVTKRDTPSPGLEVSVAAWFQSRSWDERSPFLFGAGGEVSLSLPLPAVRPSLSLVVAYQGPVTRNDANVSLAVQALSVRLLPGIKKRLGDFELEADVGGGFDFLIANTNSTAIPDQFTKDRVDLAPFLTGGLGARWHPTASTGVLLRVLLDIDPARRRYISSIAGEQTIITVPWAVRPMVQLGFSFDFVRAP